MAVVAATLRDCGLQQRGLNTVRRLQRPVAPQRTEHASRSQVALGNARTPWEVALPESRQTELVFCIAPGQS
jgi:hypothetical protein